MTKVRKIFIFIILLKFSYLYLIFPFKTRKTYININEKNLTKIFRSLIYNHIYINLEIGHPRQIIDAFLIMEKTQFYLSEQNNDINTNSPNPSIEDVGSNIENFYNKNKSDAIEITNITRNTYYGGPHEGKVIKDYLYFKLDSNEVIKIKFNTTLYNTTLGNMPAKLGLGFINYQGDKDYNFIYQLKSNDIINSYFWMINYTSDYEGNFIIGEQPHIFDPINFKENELSQTNPFVNPTMDGLGLKFDEIFFRNRSFRPYFECIFKYEFNYIRGIPEIEQELDKYFNKSIENGTCFKEYVEYPYGPNKFYYCNKEKYKDNIIYFPPLIFEHKELNFTFELDYKDLFMEKDDKLILMIFFFDSGMKWNLGKPFLRKYPFLINQDSKKIGFYKRNNDNNKNNNIENRSIILKIILIILGLFILLVIGIFIGKYYFNNKKNHKSINIIDDEYDYQTKDDEIFESS